MPPPFPESLAPPAHRCTGRRERCEYPRTQARKDSKADKKAIKQLAANSMSAASWTQGVLDGDSKYVRAEEGVEQRLAASTVGLVTADQFREKRLALEEEAQEAEEAQRRRRQAKKAKREQEQRRGLSFVEDD